MTALTYTALRKIHADHTQSELVSNGDFSSGSTGWTAADWTVTTLATHNTGNTTPITQILPTTVGYPCTVVVTTSGRTAGSVTPWMGVTEGSAITTNTTTSEVITSVSTTELAFVPTSDFDGAVDDISVIITDSWSVDVSASALNESWPIMTDEQTALDGTTETILHRQDQVWGVTTGLISTDDLTDDYWYEFLGSVYGGETFTFDALGSVAIPVNAVDVILVKGSINIAREGNTDYHRISFSVREI